MTPPQRQSVAQISVELVIHVVTLYNRRKAWRLQGEVVAGIGEGTRGMECCRQAHHGGTGDRRAQCH